MRIYRLCILVLLALGAVDAFAHFNLNRKAEIGAAHKAKLRGVCAGASDQIDIEINNVRARLLGAGDCWWNYDEGRYIVPKVDPASGQQEVSSIFAGSVWLGGVDPGQNLKLACQDYRYNGDDDFWPGPLDPIVGTTDEATCANWNRHFRVTGEDIRQHLKNLANGNLSPDAIPRNIKGWPAKGNEFFYSVWGFDLPYTTQALAGFYDRDGDTDYEPLDGDYPSIEIRGCDQDRYPDEMIFWIYNDEGGGAPHAVTKGSTIQMEVQVQAFAYRTADELNDMTFQRYKLINRATERIDSTFFAMWVDADLGCTSDDFIGCDTALSLMYTYNQDATDGDPGCSCPEGSPATYCNDVPILGVDYFRGPLRPVTLPDGRDTSVEIGMSSFMYYNNPSIGNPLPGTGDPDQPAEYYNYLTGRWRDGTPLTYGGNGYQSGGPIVKYAFPDPPNDPNGWSMCTANLPKGDRRTLQASGPFTLLPGAKNELIIGVPWVPDVEYPCPDLEQIFRADKLAQGLFDNCFDLLDGPDAPNVDWVEMNQEVVAVLTNVEPFNNVKEAYSEQDFLAPEYYRTNPDEKVRDSANYKFEGYVIYQLANPNVSAANYDDPTQARIVYQVDKKNNVSKLFNWIEVQDPFDLSKRVYYPELQVDGGDNGVRHTFSIKDDQFATGNDKRLINHKKYYYSVVAYAYNNFGNFDPLVRPVTGQQRPYLAGRGNIQIYTVIPRPIVDVALNASYGDGVAVTRLEGAGNNGTFLDLDDASRDKIFNNTDSTLTYKQGAGPITITIFNPFEVKDGQYEVVLSDGNDTDTKLQDTARWQLRRLPDGAVLASERTINELNEQLIAEYGFSVTIAQRAEPGMYGAYSSTGRLGEAPPYVDSRNGAIGGEIEWENPDQEWLQGIPDATSGPTNFVKTGFQEKDAEMDPEQALSTIGNGWFVPYVLCDWVLPALATPDNGDRLITAAWTEKVAGSQGNVNGSAIGTKSFPIKPNGQVDVASRFYKLWQLPNVDIVITSDKSKWSRCVVAEGAGYYYTGAEYAQIQDPTLVPESPANKKRIMFDTRYAPSVSKYDNDGDGLADPDGEVEPALLSTGAANPLAGQPMRGMGWFPGYAVDVETGQRLNIFFCENSCYSSTLDPRLTGRDMMWNPTDQTLLNENVFVSDIPNLLLGGQHWVYVMNTPYDGCAALREKFTPELAQATAKSQQVRFISWAGMLQLAQGFQMNPLGNGEKGLVPYETRIKLRVDDPFQTWYNDSDNGRKSGTPRYQFTIQGRERSDLSSLQVENALDSIKVVPNPYYGFSQYEVSQFSNVVKITNLPAKCKVTIYSLDGKFIRQYTRAEQYAPYSQIAPDLEWDLKNSQGIPVASGVYLIHIDAEGLGERTIKWFGIGRQFDPSGL